MRWMVLFALLPIRARALRVLGPGDRDGELSGLAPGSRRRRRDALLEVADVERDRRLLGAGPGGRGGPDRPLGRHDLRVPRGPGAVGRGRVAAYFWLMTPGAVRRVGFLSEDDSDMRWPGLRFTASVTWTAEADRR